MAIIKCPECGKEVSDKAPSCPNCGCPISTILSKQNGQTPENSTRKTLNYEKMYVVYKKIPLIIAIFIDVMFFIWSIVDYYLSFMLWGYNGDFLSRLLTLVLWWIIGATVGLISYFACAIKISPTVLRTDLLLSQKGKNETIENAKKEEKSENENKNGTTEGSDNSGND